MGHGLTHWYPSTFYLLLPIIGKELGLTYSQIGLIMTCQYIAGAIANVPGGILVDTVGRKGVLMAVSLFWVGFPYLLMGFAHSYLMLLACVALVGFGNSLWHPTAIPTLARRYPERKGLVLSLHGMGGNVGDALAPLAVGSLLAVLTWREVVFLNVMPGLVMSLLILVFLGTMRLGPRRRRGRRGARAVAGHYFRGVPALFRNRSLLLLTTSSAFRSMTQNSLLTFLPIYLAYEMGYSPFWVGAGMFALQAAGFAATPLAGHLSDRMGRRSIMMTSMLMTGVVLAFMTFAGKSLAFIVFVAVLGFFLYAIRPVMQAWLLETTPKNMGGTSIGILFGAQALGSSVAPLVAGVIADRYGCSPCSGSSPARSSSPTSSSSGCRRRRRGRRFERASLAEEHVEPDLHRVAGRIVRGRGARASWHARAPMVRIAPAGVGLPAIPPGRQLSFTRWRRRPGHLDPARAHRRQRPVPLGSQSHVPRPSHLFRRHRHDPGLVDRARGAGTPSLLVRPARARRRGALAALFGEPYRDYCRRVKRWIPGLF
jgi:MFS family permease